MESEVSEAVVAALRRAQAWEAKLRRVFFWETAVRNAEEWAAHAQFRGGLTIVRIRESAQ